MPEKLGSINWDVRGTRGSRLREDTGNHAYLREKRILKGKGKLRGSKQGGCRRFRPGGLGCKRGK